MFKIKLKCLAILGITLLELIGIAWFIIICLWMDFTSFENIPDNYIQSAIIIPTVTLVIVSCYILFLNYRQYKKGKFNERVREMYAINYTAIMFAELLFIAELISIDGEMLYTTLFLLGVRPYFFNELIKEITEYYLERLGFKVKDKAIEKQEV